MTSHRTAIIYRRERTWFFIALTMFGVAASLYMYFVSASVVHVVMRKEIDGNIADVSSSVASLEAAYIDAQHEVSTEIASMQGFSKTDEKVFIDMKTAPVALLQN